MLHQPFQILSSIVYQMINQNSTNSKNKITHQHYHYLYHYHYYYYYHSLSLLQHFQHHEQRLHRARAEIVVRAFVAPRRSARRRFVRPTNAPIEIVVRDVAAVLVLNAPMALADR
jgi:hypothetical protein